MIDPPTDPPLVADAPPTPFSPPSTYSFEPELHGPPPRQVPEELRRGPYARDRRNGILALLGSGVLCLAASYLPAIDELGRYFLPLAYLSWIGLGLIALGSGSFLLRTFRPGPFRYVTRGVPTVARIRQILMEPAQILNGQVAHFRFRVLTELRLPNVGKPALAEVLSPNFSAARKDRVTTSFSVGDYVTAVHLPEDPEGTLNLYAFLNLRPGLGLVERLRVSGTSWPAKVALEAAAVVVLFAVLFWNVYAFVRFQPLEPSYREAAWIMVLGGLILGGGFLLATYLGHRSELRGMEERNREAVARGQALETEATSFWARTGLYGFGLRVVIFAGGLLLGALTALCWAYSLNALLDDSEPRHRPVEIRQALVETHSFVFRRYLVKYRLEEDEEDRELSTNPKTLSSLLHSDGGLAEVREGWLGWPWVDRIRPADDG